MRILFLSPYPASPRRSRLYGFMTRVARQHQVEMLALCTSAREQSDVQALQQAGFIITAQSESVWRGLLRSTIALPSPVPLQVAFCASSRLQATLREHLAQGKFDLLHVESLRALGILPSRMTVPVVWDAVDCISQLYRHGSHAGATLPLRLLGKLEAERVCACEWAQLQRFQHILVTAERERQALLALPQARQKAEVTAEAEGALAEITVLTHGIDPAYFQPYSGTRRPETLIFSGKMDFHANIAAACLLVQRIMPLIWRERPNARLIIAGSDPPAHIRSFASDSRIEVTGYLSDLRLVISQAQIAVCPLPYAVGVQNKVLEAMALGTPVVASSNVAAGLQAIGDQDLLIEDEPEAFASAVLRLLDDVSLRLSLAKKGIAYIATHHNWDTILQKLLAVYQRAISP